MFRLYPTNFPFQFHVLVFEHDNLSGFQVKLFLQVIEVFLFLRLDIFFFPRRRVCTPIKQGRLSSSICTHGGRIERAFTGSMRNFEKHLFLPDEATVDVIELLTLSSCNSFEIYLLSRRNLTILGSFTRTVMILV